MLICFCLNLSFSSFEKMLIVTFNFQDIRNREKLVTLKPKKKDAQLSSS